MSVTLFELQNYCETLLHVGAFNDYCPNGLQVQSQSMGSKVNTIVAGVTASEALIDAAIVQQADVLLVHHGYFWKGEDAVLTGVKGTRVAKLIKNDISLFAYHLPLDAHPELGNNAQLAKLLDFKSVSGLDDGQFPVGNVGHIETPLSLSELSNRIGERLSRTPLTIGDQDREISSVAWCTGAAQSYIEKAAAKGVDCFITGEVSEPTVHLARELGIAFIAAGHHATERYGVKALAAHLEQAFAVNAHFIDIDNPV